MKPGQLIKYIRADGVEINLHSPPSRAVMNMAGWGYPPVDVHTITGPFQHGATVLGYRFQPRTITLDVVKKGLSRSDWFSERSRLIDRLGLQTTNPNLPELGRLQWEYVENDTIKTRALDCYLSRGLGYGADPQWFEWGILESLEFTANDPFVYDPNLHTTTITTFTAQLTLPMTFPFTLSTSVGSATIAYDGTWYTTLVIEIDGPTNGITIINETTGSTLELDYFINTGTTVTFDLTSDIKTVTDDLGNNLINYVHSSDMYSFLLNPGSNILSVYVRDSTAATEVRFKYYSRFVGV